MRADLEAQAVQELVKISDLRTVTSASWPPLLSACHRPTSIPNFSLSWTLLPMTRRLDASWT